MLWVGGQRVYNIQKKTSRNLKAPNPTQLSGYSWTPGAIHGEIGALACGVFYRVL